MITFFDIETFFKKHGLTIILVVLVIILLFSNFNQKRIESNKIRKEYEQTIQNKNDSINLFQLRYLKDSLYIDSIYNELDSLEKIRQQSVVNITNINQHYDKIRGNISSMSNLELIEYFSSNISKRDSL